MRAVLWLAVSTAQQASEDKTSLIEQERAALDLCQRESWQVIDVLRVPGHSRHYIDIHEASADMLKAGIDAFDKLMQHWRARDFDVLVVRDGNRFARTQSLHTYVVEATIRAGARIYSLQDGWVDAQNFRMYAAMNGYMAAAHVDQMVRQREAALERNASKGRPGLGKPPFGYQVLRSDKVIPVCLIPDPGVRCILDEAADLLLQGIGWHRIANTLSEAGHRTPTGARWQPSTVRRLFYNPSLWGHTARRYLHYAHGRERRWAYDEREPVPGDVSMYRSTHEPMWSGERAEAIRAELRRREVVRGRENRHYPFGRFIVCAECGRYYVSRPTASRGYFAYGCVTRRRDNEACSNRQFLRVEYVQQVVDDLLRQAIDAADVSTLLAPSGDTADYASAIASAEFEIEALQRKLLNLVLQSAESGAELQPAYAEAMSAVQAQIEAVTRQIQRLTAQAASADTTTQQSALDALNLDAFWQQDGHIINVTLHRIFGQRRLLALNGEIIGLCDAPESE